VRAAYNENIIEVFFHKRGHSYGLPNNRFQVGARAPRDVPEGYWLDWSENYAPLRAHLFCLLVVILSKRAEAKA
jgi:hypothetical protein